MDMGVKAEYYAQCPVCHAPLKDRALSSHLDDCPMLATDGQKRFRRDIGDDKGSQVFCTYVMRKGRKVRPKKANVFSFKVKRKPR